MEPQPIEPEPESPLGEVIPLPRRSDDGNSSELASSSSTSEDQLASSDFDELVAAIEAADRAPLVKPGRDWCRDAHASHPAGFAQVVDDVLRRKVIKVDRRSLLVHKVKWGDHLKAERVRGSAPTGSLNSATNCRHPQCRYQPQCLGELA